jgi:hypothetical protein
LWVEVHFRKPALPKIPDGCQTDILDFVIHLVHTHCHWNPDLRMQLVRIGFNSPCPHIRMNRLTTTCIDGQ